MASAGVVILLSALCRIDPARRRDERIRCPTVYLARHGETAWSLSGQHTGLDRPAADRARRTQRARRWASGLRGLTFAQGASRVRCSAPQRTCELAGFGGVARGSTAISSNGTTASTKGKRTAEILARTSRLGALSRRLPRRRIAGATSARAPTA